MHTHDAALESNSPPDVYCKIIKAPLNIHFPASINGRVATQFIHAPQSLAVASGATATPVQNG